MDALLTTLTRAVEGQPAIALAGAFAWGLASLLLSPCHLASIPLVVGVVSGQRHVTPARGLTVGALFSLGLLTTIAVVGGATAAAGRMLGDVGPWPSYVVAIVFFVVGLSLLDIMPLTWNSPDTSRLGGRGPTRRWSSASCSAWRSARAPSRTWRRCWASRSLWPVRACGTGSR